MARRVHILGASGSGTTTLAQALAARLGCPHHDVDDYFWLPSDPPFEHIRDREARSALLGAELEKPGDWVLSGSLCGWGDVYIPLFDLVVFLWIPHEIRMARLAAREVARYGVAIEPGGAIHAGSIAFMKWAAGYDEGGLEMRSCGSGSWGGRGLSMGDYVTGLGAHGRGARRRRGLMLPTLSEGRDDDLGHEGAGHRAGRRRHRRLGNRCRCRIERIRPRGGPRSHPA